MKPTIEGHITLTDEQDSECVAGCEQCRGLREALEKIEAIMHDWNNGEDYCDDVEQIAHDALAKHKETQ